METIKEIWNYRQMIISLVRKDLRGRYKGSVLGFLWTFLNPLLQLIVFTIVFGLILNNEIEKYYLFLFVGLVPWNFFSSSLVTGSHCIIGEKNMVTKIYFPREILPIVNTTSGFVNMLLTFIIILVVVIISGTSINFLALLCLPIVFFLEYILVLGFAFLFSSITVYFRDLEYFLGIITMAWMYLTPIVYDVSIIPENILPIFYANPMTPIVTAYRNILYYGQIPVFSSLINGTIFSIVILVAGWLTFQKLKKRFVEEL